MEVRSKSYPNNQGEVYDEFSRHQGAFMIKVMVYDHGFKGYRMDESATPRDRDHKMTPTPSGTMSMKDSTWRISSNQLRL